MNDQLWRLLTDKADLGYYQHYKKLASQIGPTGRVLEVGVHKGGSLMMWRELFPEGIVVGIDNGSYGHTFYPPGARSITADQDDPVIREKAREFSPEGYDLIVDDASHIGKLSEVTFGLLFPLVKPGRWYVLEDWAAGYLPQYGVDDSILRFAESLLPMITPDPGTEIARTVPPGDIDSIEYRFSQAIIHKRGRA